MFSDIENMKTKIIALDIQVADSNLGVQPKAVFVFTNLDCILIRLNNGNKSDFVLECILDKLVCAHLE
jgi:hypothetical protein